MSDDVQEAAPEAPAVQHAVVPMALLNEVTQVLLEQPAGRVFDLLTRLRAEVVVE